MCSSSSSRLSAELNTPQNAPLGHPLSTTARSPIPPDRGGTRSPRTVAAAYFLKRSRMSGSERPRSSGGSRYRPNPVGRLVEGGCRQWPLSVIVTLTGFSYEDRCRGSRIFPAVDHRFSPVDRDGEGWVEGSSVCGDHLLGEQFGDGDGLGAVGAFAPEADLAHEGGAVGAALFAEGPVAAAVALVDGDRPAGLAALGTSRAGRPASRLRR